MPHTEPGSASPFASSSSTAACSIVLFLFRLLSFPAIASIFRIARRRVERVTSSRRPYLVISIACSFPADRFSTTPSRRLVVSSSHGKSMMSPLSSTVAHRGGAHRRSSPSRSLAAVAIDPPPHHLANESTRRGSSSRRSPSSSPSVKGSKRSLPLFSRGSSSQRSSSS